MLNAKMVHFYPNRSTRPKANRATTTTIKQSTQQGGAGWGGDGAGKAKAKATPAVVLERMDVFTKLHDEDKVSVWGGGRVDWPGAWTCVDRRSNWRSIPHHGLTRFRFPPFPHLDDTGAHLERGHHVAALVAARDLPRPRRDARGLLHFQHQVSELFFML